MQLSCRSPASWALYRGYRRCGLSWLWFAWPSGKRPILARLVAFLAIQALSLGAGTRRGAMRQVSQACILIPPSIPVLPWAIYPGVSSEPLEVPLV